MPTITKKDIVNQISDQTGANRIVVGKVVQLFLDDIIDEIGRGIAACDPPPNIF